MYLLQTNTIISNKYKAERNIYSITKTLAKIRPTKIGNEYKLAFRRYQKLFKDNINREIKRKSIFPNLNSKIKDSVTSLLDISIDNYKYYPERKVIDCFLY